MEAITPTNLVFTALRKLGVYSASEASQVTADEISAGVAAANLLIDSWTTQGLTIPCNVREIYTLSANENAVTIGSPGANSIGATGILATVRPERLTAVSVVQNGAAAMTLTSLTSSGSTAMATKSGHGFNTGQVVMIAGANEGEYNGAWVVTRTAASTFTYQFAGSATTPATGVITATDGTNTNTVTEIFLGELTYDGWIALTIKGQQNAWPTRYYYENTFEAGLGTCYFWPVPTQSNIMAFYMPRQLAAFSTTALTTAVIMAPGYIRALVYNLAMELKPEYGRKLADIENVPQLAMQAFADMKRANDKSTVLSPGDAGFIFGRAGDFYGGLGYNIYTGP